MTATTAPVKSFDSLRACASEERVTIKRNARAARTLTVTMTMSQIKVVVSLQTQIRGRTVAMSLHCRLSAQPKILSLPKRNLHHIGQGETEKKRIDKSCSSSQFN